MKSHFLWSVSLALIGLVLSGCTPGATGAPPTIKVTGKVTYGGGDWPANAKPELSFTTVADGSSPIHSGKADVKPNGDYEVSTSIPGDGLVPGKYQISVFAWDPPGGPADNPMAKSLVPKNFESGSTSGLTIDVPAGSGPIKKDFDVPKAP